MFKLDIKHIYFRIDYGNNLDEHLAGLKRSAERSESDVAKDLCGDCVASFVQWLKERD